MSLRRILRDRRQARLLAAARTGDRCALQRLYRELYAPVTRYLDARLERREDTEDLTSVVFHRFLERLQRYRPERGSVATWVLTMAHSALVDHYRSSKPALSAEGLVEILAGRAPSPLESVLRDERVRRIRGLLGELPPETRRMLSLRYEQDLRYREIAACMGLTEDTVKQRFSRTLRELRRRAAEQPSSGNEVDCAI